MTLLGIVQGIFQFMSGPFGVAIIGIAVLVAFFRMSLEHRSHAVFWALGGGVGFYATAWILSSLLQGAGG